MGKIASKYCRKIFITDDNPRNENPQKIRNEIIKVCKKIAVNIGSRKKAIETASTNGKYLIPIKIDTNAKQPVKDLNMCNLIFFVFIK